VLGCLAVLCTWTASGIYTASQAVEESSVQMEECLKLGREIRQSQQHREQASVRALTDTEILDRIETARDRVKLPAAAISAVELLTSARIGSTDFKRQETLVQLQPTELARLAQLVAAIEETPSSLLVSRIRLTAAAAPRGTTDPRELWNVEISLTQVVYDPITAR
jgi:hypothetical protein